MPNSCIHILLDGLGDRSYARLGHRTPLQAAHTPCLDRLAAMGGNGLYHAGKLGQPLPSENAHFAIFGSPKEEFPGRGALEALGGDMALGPDDVAVLAHFACVEPTEDQLLELRYDRVCGTADETIALFGAIHEFEHNNVHIHLHCTSGMFGVLRITGDVSPYITDSNPMVDGRYIAEVKPLADHAKDPAAVRTAEALNTYLRWAYATLSHIPENLLRIKQTLPPINGVVTQRAGRLVPHQSLHERYGLRGMVMASGTMYKGMARYLGMDFVQVRDKRHDPGNDLAERLEAALGHTATHDFIHVHTKAPDRAAHAKSPAGKVKAIESLDRGLAQMADALLAQDILLVVAADHSTPSSGPLIHSGEPVPVMFVGKGVRRDGVSAYDEIKTATGALSLMRGDEMLHMILNHLDRARLRGIHDTPEPIEYWPGQYAPLSLNTE